MSREKAQAKIEEWFAGVTTPAFEAAVELKIANGHPERDSIIFVGASREGRRLEIVTRLDEYGNVEADLTEVTVVVTRKKCPEITEPPPMPLAEVVKTVAQHQAAGFSPSTVTQL